MDELYYRILQDIKSMRINSTHCHHREDQWYTDMSLEKILSNSYVTFIQPLVADTREQRSLFLERNRYNTYFLWLERAILDLYGFRGQITVDNWDEISRTIHNAYKTHPQRHLDILTQQCRYDRIVQDCYWKPGSNLGHPQLFAPAYRISMFTYALDEQPHDLDNVYLYEQCPRSTRPADLDEFIDWMEQQIIEHIHNGCTALKSALAYARDLHYQIQDRDHIAKLYRMDRSQLTDKDRHDFSDYVIDEICKIAAKLDVPFQHHTGLGAIHDTNAMQLRPLIERNPDTKFVLFHGSYPWLEDIYALIHNLPNTYADLCWLPLISTSASSRMLLELLEVGQTNRIHWGCDTWTSEESYSAVLAITHVLAQVLSTQVRDGWYTYDDATFIARRILYENTKELYKL